MADLIYIGDLSRKDAELLADYATDKDVLEFGAGGSTQIFDQVAKSVTTVETSQEWIEATKKLCTEKVLFIGYDEPIDKTYDIIFVDGYWAKRLDFANRHWDKLNENGVILFHDTRRDKDKRIVSQFLLANPDNIRVIWNENASNITSVAKSDKRFEVAQFKNLSYENWNETEGKEKWMYKATEKRPRGWKAKLKSVL